jgi:hypothetical protein
MKTLNQKHQRPQNNENLNEIKTKKEDYPNFLLKLYTILETPEFKNIINWSEDGKYFSIINLHDFTENILPKFYKHNNFSSFVRQLNMYDFHKKRSNQNEHIFQHPKFIKGKQDLIKTIKRKNKKENIMQEQNNDLLNNNLLNNHQALVEYCNCNCCNPIIPMNNNKKVTKHSLEKALNFLIQSVNENSIKQKNLEEKVEKLGKQNEDFLTQNQQMLQEILKKSEYNKKLEAVVYFILELIIKKPKIKNSNNELNNLLSPNEISANDFYPYNFNNYLGKQFESKEIPNNNKNIPMLTSANSFSNKEVPMSPIHYSQSRKGSIDSLNMPLNLDNSIISNNSNNNFYDLDFKNNNLNNDFFNNNNNLLNTSGLLSNNNENFFQNDKINDDKNEKIFDDENEIESIENNNNNNIINNN